MADAYSLWSSLGGHCAAVVVDHGPLLVSLFLTGLVGSATHCSTMCGPLVVMQVTERLKDQMPGPGADLRRLVGAALLPYQFGRMTTYIALGAVLTLPIGLTFMVRDLWWVTPAMLAVVAMMLIWQAMPRLARSQLLPARAAYAAARQPESLHCQGATRTRLTLVVGWLAQTARPLFRRPTGWRGYMLGLLLGFLPCGLLYTALALAATGRDPLAAALGMLFFTLGTLPMSWLVGLGSVALGGRFRALLQRALPALIAMNVLLVLGLAYYSLLVGR